MTIVLAQAGESFSHAVSSGSIFVGAFCSLLAGLVSFASPCVIPLVPGYLSYLSNLVSDTNSIYTHTRTHAIRRVTTATACFIIGFTVVFIAGTVSLFGLMSVLVLNHRMIQMIGGIITMVMAAVFLGVFKPFQTIKILPKPDVTGHLGAMILGAVFALSWSPCLGPTLSSVLALTAGTQGMTLIRGIIMMCCYCLGLGLPFLLSAYGSSFAVSTMSWLKKYMIPIHVISGIVLFAVGFALACGQWDSIVEWFRQLVVSDWQAPI